MRELGLVVVRPSDMARIRAKLPEMSRPSFVPAIAIPTMLDL